MQDYESGGSEGDQMRAAVVADVRSQLCDSQGEEIASALSHWLGVVLGIIALVWMLREAAGDPLEVAVVAVFGATLILLYLCSAMYHQVSGIRMKMWLQVADHVCIYLLIAGTYTPLALITLRGPVGIALLVAVWSMAIVGVVCKLWLRHRISHWFFVILYVAMGWAALLALGPLLRELPWRGFLWLLAGGLSYTLGIAFYAWDRLRFNHAVWHLFVLGGSFCHVIAVWKYVL